jgi:uncharacterized protein YqgC (DUF456 family)
MVTLLVVLLLLVFLVGLAMVPLGLPGLWVMVLGLIGYGWATDFRSVGVAIIASVSALAFLGEILEAWVGFHYSRKLGASRRAGWGALVGGILGAVVGVPVPVVGSIIGSFAGSFLGAVLLEYTGPARATGAIRAGWGALLGRTWAVATKSALGIVIAVIGLVGIVSR